MSGRRIELTGTVQGVGMRPWVYRLAQESGVRGRVRNDSGGVVIEAYADDAVLDRFLEKLRGSLPPAADVRTMRSGALSGEPPTGFSIVSSEPAAHRRVSIPADLATCDDCLREMREPGDRRYHYPFINCVSCGPRYTILLDLPYDRAATTMARFAMCPACREEYESPASRRFHAEPNACPVCGPRLLLLGGEDGDPLEVAGAALRQGRIVAVKGIGGFHLACDARSEKAVARLRARKRREEKPLAVMVADLAEAERLAEVGHLEATLLSSVERPIVLLPRRTDAALAESVAPGNPLVGVMLAYSPLHHLLLEEARRPLVMTSGNLSDEPLAASNEEAVERLAGIADVILGHDRDIATPCDDSVARTVAGAPMILRRARGHVPRSMPVRRQSAAPILAVGAQLKNAACILSGDAAVLGPHVGDLDSEPTYRHFEAHLERLEKLAGVHPEVVAHDLHPDYLSTVYALARPAARRIAVQHHHAHVASVMAERGLPGPVIGVAYDGTGLGTDGTAWGGEVLLCEAARFTRMATLRPLRLVGGDRAVHETWRQALAAVDDAYGGKAPLDRFDLFRRVDPERLEQVKALLADPDLAGKAHGAGRWFDALGALALARPVSGYEGQIPLEWTLLADPAERRPWRFALDREGDLLVVDLRPTVRAFCDDLLAGAPRGVLASRFHATLALATAEAVKRVAASAGKLPVVLSGGCFQNAALAEALIAALPGFAVHLPCRAPPGDGGLSLGQALVADAVLAGG